MLLLLTIAKGLPELLLLLLTSDLPELLLLLLIEKFSIDQLCCVVIGPFILNSHKCQHEMLGLFLLMPFFWIFFRARDNETDSEITAAEVVEIQTMLGDAINRIVKFHHKSLNEKIRFEFYFKSPLKIANI